MMRTDVSFCNHEIENMDEAYRDNMAFLDEIGGNVFPTMRKMPKSMVLSHVTIAQAAEKIRQADIVIPF
jgi:hypothetical protein